MSVAGFHDLRFLYFLLFKTVRDPTKISEASNIWIDKLLHLLDAGEAFVEITMLESIAGIEELPSNILLEQILFGFHVSSFYFESTVLKLHKPRLPTKRMTTIAHEDV